MNGTAPPKNGKGDAPTRERRQNPNTKVSEASVHPAPVLASSSALTCSFPRWSPDAVLTEATRNWNLLHPGKPFDPESGSWTFACVVIDSWLRHAVSNYDGKETNN